mmetsp:Transcript_12394/g.30505  ORF Transcript_12394/g.30505 Transcript_12394/m.30505 type:complete len:448 (+) Transcript_12394:644-1987(+)
MGPFRAFKMSGGWKEHPGAVLTQIDVRGISDIDISKGTFMMSCYIRLVFYDPHATKPPTLPKGSDPKSYHDIYEGASREICVPPLIRTRNSVQGDALYYKWGEHLPKPFEYDGKLVKNIWIQELFLNNVEFYEKFELGDFPFDVQGCSAIFALIHTQANKSCFNHLGTEVKDGIKEPQFLLPWLGQMHMKSEQRDYYLLRPEVSTHNNFSWGKEGKGRLSQILIHRTLVTRKHNWYTLNFIFILGLISTASFFTFASDSIDARYENNINLLLTITAFKLSVGDFLPKTPDITVLDLYILSCFLLVLSILAKDAVMGLFLGIDPDDINGHWEGISVYEAEFAFGISLFAIWILGHIFLAAGIIAKSRNYIRVGHSREPLCYMEQRPLSTSLTVQKSLVVDSKSFFQLARFYFFCCCFCREEQLRSNDDTAEEQDYKDNPPSQTGLLCS